MKQLSSGCRLEQKPTSILPLLMTAHVYAFYGSWCCGFGMGREVNFAPELGRLGYFFG